MQVTFKFFNDDVKKVLRRILVRVHGITHFEKIFFSISDRNGFHFSDSDLYVDIPRGNVDNEDFLVIDVLRNIFMADLERCSHNTGVPFIDGMMVGNRIIQNGFGNEYLLYNMFKMRSFPVVKTIDDFLYLNSLYIVFHRHDNHDYNFLKSIAKKVRVDSDIVQQSSDLLDVMHNNMTSENMSKLASFFSRTKEPIS
ncbi:MAG: hypothetical protein ABIA21_01835 [Candidatus Aenigmatarchaeota archaeon]